MPHLRMPKGIMFLAVVWFLMAGFFVLLGSLFAVAPATLRSFGVRDLDGPLRQLGFGFFGGVGALAGAVGSGLWRLKRWAHHFVLGTAGITLVRDVMNFLMSGIGDSTPNALLNVAAFVLPLAALWYLWTPSVLAAFGVQRRSVGGNEEPGT